MVDLDIKVVPQKFPVLGRQMVHDPRSRNFAVAAPIDKSKWKNHKITIYDPKPNPNQCHGECTCVAKCVAFNAEGNRKKGHPLDMTVAHELYHIATSIDPFEGTWPPDDTGSSGLAACKAAQQLGYGGEYRFVFGGADEVVQLIQMDEVVNCGTWWYADMFNPDAHGVIAPSGARVGGHEYVARGYDLKKDLVMIRCWWGQFKDVWIKREQLNTLLMDGGDAHIQDRLK